jgi:hypothetical protein
MVYTGSSHRHVVLPVPHNVLETSAGRGPVVIQNEGEATAYLQVGFNADPATGKPMPSGGYMLVHTEQTVSLCCAEGASTEVSVTPGYGFVGQGVAGGVSGDLGADYAAIMADVVAASVINSAQVMESIRDLLRNIDLQLSLIRDA